jgi:hypothetical protein
VCVYVRARACVRGWEEGRRAPRRSRDNEMVLKREVTSGRDKITADSGSISPREKPITSRGKKIFIHPFEGED